MKTRITALMIMAVVLSASGPEAKADDFERTTALIESGNFQFTVRSASPAGARTVQITSSYIMKASDGIYEARLPYYGRVYSGGYGDGGSVEFKGEPEDLEITRNDKKKTISLKFSIKTASEKYDIKLEVGKSGYGNLVVSSPKRQTISYYGLISALED